MSLTTPGSRCPRHQCKTGHGCTSTCTRATRPPSHQAAEIDRLLGLGASHVDWQDYPEGVDFAVLADTDGAASA
jgi:hypothetical protein